MTAITNLVVDLDFENYVVEKVILEPEAIPLKGNPFSAFTLRIADDCCVTLWLRVVDDEELTANAAPEK